MLGNGTISYIQVGCKIIRSNHDQFADLLRKHGGKTAKELKVAGKKVPTDLKRVADILRSANYQGYVALEYEAAADPYTAIPPLLKKLRATFA